MSPEPAGQLVSPEPLPDPGRLGDGVVAVRLLVATDASAIAGAVPAGEPGAWDSRPGPYSLADVAAIVSSWEEGRRRGARIALAVLEDGAPDGDDGVVYAGSVVLLRGAPAAKERGDVAGQLEAGYWIRPAARGRGFAGRALRLTAEWALGNRGIERVWLEIDREHAASRRVAVRAGFLLTGVRWAAERPSGTPGDVLIYERTAGR